MSDALALAQRERELIAVAATVLEEFRVRIVRAGLTFRGPELKVWITDPERYTSEVRIIFYANSNVHDVLEFFLFRDGRQVVSDEEVRTWMLEQVDGILSR